MTELWVDRTMAMAMADGGHCRWRRRRTKEIVVDRMLSCQWRWMAAVLLSTAVMVALTLLLLPGRGVPRGRGRQTTLLPRKQTSQGLCWGGSHAPPPCPHVPCGGRHALSVVVDAGRSSDHRNHSSSSPQRRTKRKGQVLKGRPQLCQCLPSAAASSRGNSEMSSLVVENTVTRCNASSVGGGGWREQCHRRRKGRHQHLWMGAEHTNCGVDNNCWQRRAQKPLLDKIF